MEVYTTTLPSILTGLSASVHSPVEMLVTDPSGNKTGYDPTTGTMLNQIPNSSYFVQSLGDDANPTSPPLESKTFYASGVGSGTYKVEVIGTGNGNYTLDLLGYNQAGTSGSSSLTGHTTAGQITTIQVQYSTDSGLTHVLYFPFIRR